MKPTSLSENRGFGPMRAWSRMYFIWLLGAAFVAHISAALATVAINCPADIMASAPTASGAVVTFQVTATSTTGGSPIVTCVPPSGTRFPLGITTVKCTATDSLRQTAQCTFNVVVRDTTAPTLTVPDPILIECAPASGKAVEFLVSATDNVDTNLIVVCNPPSGTVFPVGTNTVNCVVRDAAGNPTRKSFTITVVGDKTAPVISLPTNIDISCAEGAGAVAKFNVSAIDDCDGRVDVLCTPAPGGIFPIGTTIVQCVAHDASGNYSTNSFQVVVHKEQFQPILTMPTVVSNECTSPAGAIVNFQVTAASPCGKTVRIECNPSSGSQFPMGTTAVQCLAIDSSGLTATGTFNVVVSSDCVDCLELQCPRGITALLGISAEAVVKYAPLATNTCTHEPVTVTCDPPSGSSFPLGDTIVHCMATDGRVTKECSFTVNVKDKTPPVVLVPRAISVPCSGSSGGQAGVNVRYTVTASDNVDTNVDLRIAPPSGSFFPIGTNTVSCYATDDSGNTAFREFSVVVYPGPKCEPPPVDNSVSNWGFELGLVTWTPSGDAFDYQPNDGDVTPTERESGLRNQMEDSIGGDYWRNVDYSVGHKGKRWVSTGHNKMNTAGSIFESDREALTGTLQSRVFTLNKPWISFLIGGGNDMDRLRVEFYFEIDTASANASQIQVDGRTFTYIYPVTGTGRELMHRVFLPVKEYVGRNAVIRIVDNSSTGHLNVDDFRFHFDPFNEKVHVGASEFPAYVESNGYNYDWDSPVWGFVDMHTHPISYLGFGGKLMHGRPDGPVWAALSDCNPTHGGPGWDNPFGDYLREIVIKVSDDKGIDPHREGYDADEWKSFRKWPAFSTITHQQMYYPWIKRAYDGGLRTMVALCVNNPLLGLALKGSGDRDDKAVGDAQIAELKAFVDRHSDFMEIALDPVQYRDIIRRNKLAVIIGSELDDIGNLYKDPLVHEYADVISKQKVTQELERLHNLGLRYIFPVHLMDNLYGGTGVGSDMLNIASKYYNGYGFKVKAASADDNITATMSNLDLFQYLGDGLLTAINGPGMVDLFQGKALTVENALGVVPPGSSSMGGAILPVGMIGLAPLIVTELVADGVPLDIFPVGDNYPHPPSTSHGHRNTRTLTPLGEHAIHEMMRLGMMIDMDHMSQDMADEVIKIATKVPGGYPLNSGHNSFREINVERGENNRSPSQMASLRQLGGIMGVGYENSATKPFADAVPFPQYSSSSVLNNSAGSSKSFAQNYLYALEKLGRHGIGFGTDINGIVAGPGPRFGGQGSFALPDENKEDPDGVIIADRRDDEIKAQGNGVLYSPKHGRPITSASFAGKAVDPDREFDDARTWKGYLYNKDQRDFMAALRIFFWRKDSMSNDQDTEEELLKKIESGLVGAYDTRRVKEYAFGLLKGIKNWEPGSDVLSGDTGTREQLGKAICRKKLFNEPVPHDIEYDYDKFQRFGKHLKVWADYQSIFGANAPMKRCVTHTKEWDINFDGVAHYGLLPDFIQDLSNVGVNSDDLTPLFQSSEHFAQMWTHTLEGSYHFQPHIVTGTLAPTFDQAAVPAGLGFTFSNGGEEYDIEASADLLDPSAWHTVEPIVISTNAFQKTIILPSQGENQYYRLKKRP